MRGTGLVFILGFRVKIRVWGLGFRVIMRGSGLVFRLIPAVFAFAALV